MQFPKAQERAAELLKRVQPFCECVEIAGSIRRAKRADIKDVELVAIPRIEERVIPPAPGELVFPGMEVVKQVNLLWEWAESAAASDITWQLAGPKYRKGTLPDGTQLDLFTATEASWGYQLVLRTGPAEFSKALGPRAEEVGLKCAGGFVHLGSEDGPLVLARTEPELFAILGIVWLDPDQRLDRRSLRFVEPRRPALLGNLTTEVTEGQPESSPVLPPSLFDAGELVADPGVGAEQAVHVAMGAMRRQHLMQLRQVVKSNPGDAPLLFHDGRETALSGLTLAPVPEVLVKMREIAERFGGRVWLGEHPGRTRRAA